MKAVVFAYHDIGCTGIEALLEAGYEIQAVFTHAGRTYELLPIQETPDSRLFFILTDLTAGEETYGAGRFLYADAPKDGITIVDFNRAYNPPCAFTPYSTCPMPPPENRLDLRVAAGEKKPLPYPE